MKILLRKLIPVLYLFVSISYAVFSLDTDPRRPSMKLPVHLEFRSDKAKAVSVAGDFNDWSGSTKGKFDPAVGKMTSKGDGIWIFPLSNIASGNHQFKFVIDGEWESGPNRAFTLDEKGRLIDPTGGVISVTLETPSTMRIRFSNLMQLPRIIDDIVFAVLPHGTILGKSRYEGKYGEGEIIDLHCRDINISENLRLEIRGLSEKPILRPILLDGIFHKGYISDKTLGVIIQNDPPTTMFRVYAPRAKAVKVAIFSDPKAKMLVKEIEGFKDSAGVWEMRSEGILTGKYYGFHVDGPIGEGEGFDPKKLWPDPYSKASIYHKGPSIIVDDAATGDGFHGWTDQNFITPEKQDLVVWECSIRDLTAHAGSKVQAPLRGKYPGLAATVGLGTGIDHAKELGINAMEFLPVFEFDDDPPGTYHWGYMTSLFFSPEASYAENPMGGQVNEFKALINTLHNHGIAVILDVVYNHTGAPHVFMGMDKKYFYRHDGNLTPNNFSGCGNDFKSENPMARRMILDSLEYWVRQYHIDGFRFDLAELLDHETLLVVEAKLKAINPNIILFAEPWSFRGTNKGQLKNTAWASWNDDFRNRVKEAAQGKIGANELFSVLRGSLDLWTASPWESVNYVESHDNYTLVDHLSGRSDHDGSNPSPLEIRKNLFCAAATLLSPGIPMLAEGQEMLRTKRGNENSYNAGDVVNAVDYGLREKNKNVFSFYKGLIALRQSFVGKIIREADAETCRNVVRVDSSNSHGIGLLWKDSKDVNRQTLILFNGDNVKPAVFQAKLRHGTWVRLVGDSKIFSFDQLFKREMHLTPAEEGMTSMELPPLGVEVWSYKRK